MGGRRFPFFKDFLDCVPDLREFPSWVPFLDHKTETIRKKDDREVIPQEMGTKISGQRRTNQDKKRDESGRKLENPSGLTPTLSDVS